MQSNERSALEKTNKGLILRERLALQRTRLANQSTFLSFLRTSMYFLIAGLSINNLLQVENGVIFQIILFSISILLFILGIINYFRNATLINQSEIHVGNFRDDYVQD